MEHGWISLALRAGIALAVFAVVLIIYMRFGEAMMWGNRQEEWAANKETELPTPRGQFLGWTLIHIRDDIGSLTGHSHITNAVLAAILAVLIVS